jgi:hypothetical protein
VNNLHRRKTLRQKQAKLIHQKLCAFFASWQSQNKNQPKAIPKKFCAFPSSWQNKTKKKPTLICTRMGKIAMKKNLLVS